MTARFAAALAGLSLILLVGEARASTVSFSYMGTEFYGMSPPIDASGSLTLDSDDNITSASGTINGSSITGLDPSGFNAFIFSVRDNGESVKIKTSDGLVYSFDEENGQISNNPDGYDRGTFSVNQVPLPPSAPLFGAAILALGASGYTVKRKRAAAPA